MRLAPLVFFFFFFNDTATTEIYTLSLHDALPISARRRALPCPRGRRALTATRIPPLAHSSPGARPAGSSLGTPPDPPPPAAPPAPPSRDARAPRPRFRGVARETPTARSPR